MTNRLAQCQSLYLYKHAENPIDWWPWCDEALETAKAQDKPIFLSIGYSSCHWCTVMEGEAFSNRAIAEYMNGNFLPIKVDREERPDIDSIYMQALQMMTGQGGWPLNVFLTPDDLIPFYGGTYFPVEPRYGRPGFLELLQAIRRYYDREKQKLQAFKEEILSHMQQAAVLSPKQDIPEDLLWRGFQSNLNVLSRRDYGPSFPMMPYAQLVLQSTRFNLQSQSDPKEAIAQRGTDLVLGGIYDHVGGGFHRYTVDPTWTVPHFEKMLYDNGQILEFLANLWSSGTREPAFKRAVAGTVDWLTREMTAPEGYFYAAQDADSFTTPDDAEPEEGAFYVWSTADLQQHLTPDELKALKTQFHITPEGNFEGQIVLQRRHLGKLDDTVESALTKLFQLRYGTPPDGMETFPPARNNQEAKTQTWPGRIPPVTDTKTIVAWNSLMISGLARAAVVFEETKYLDIATKAANFILENQWIDGRFHRLNYQGQASVLAQSEDYAFFIKALLDLHQAQIPDNAADNPWLDLAIRVHEEFDRFVWSEDKGGYYNTANDAGDDLIVRERSYMDNATPSANGVAIASLVRLALLTENLSYLDRALNALQAFASIMERAPSACPTLFSALDWYRHPTLVRTTTTQIPELIRQYFPTCMYQQETDLPTGSVGLVCAGLSCKEPATTLEQLLEQIRTLQTHRN
ncbi:thioredoxin domain-containing protein [Phormidium sp. CCY1219]|uniref:thioredoxin domain-containing protein n=1 Tax=Phormidium sp. CCY1219 TaxID=2886104 RepID=UPI002D1F96D0|nr:thioredoxin domain-containing protein [Phormidium sp. CCY1219]MEB3829374.1 thioredoxin domain-containing protein [Phormidium sp. CCY1219]